jgi:hypothetical protein
MDRALHAVAAALAELDDAELHALIAATNRVPGRAPSLLAWIAGACDWELARRDGLDRPLQPPAIPPEEETVCIDAANCLRAMFAQGAHGEHALFDALADLVTPAASGSMGSGIRPRRTRQERSGATSGYVDTPRFRRLRCSLIRRARRASMQRLERRQRAGHDRSGNHR